jgi:hypothetical protein
LKTYPNSSLCLGDFSDGHRVLFLHLGAIKKIKAIWKPYEEHHAKYGCDLGYLLIEGTNGVKALAKFN